MYSIVRAFKNKIYKYVAAILKNLYIDILDGITNTTIHIIAQSKWSLLMKNQTYILTLVNKLMIKILNLKLLMLLKYLNIKTFLQKSLQDKLVWRCFCDKKKLKILSSNINMLLLISKAKKLLECFTKMNCKRHVKKSLELKK